MSSTDLGIEAECRPLEGAERAFHELAQSIAEAPDVSGLMEEVVDGAASVADAAGAFVEGMIANNQVEILATTGEGTPPKGERVAYPGSLTEEIIDKRKPVFLVKMEGIGVAMAPYLKRQCDGCSALVVPVFGATGPLGALVLLRRPDEPQFEADVIARVQTVGDLASIAMQRIATLAESERRREIAEAAVHSRDEVLAVVSHDLRNPLHTIVASASLLAEEPGMLAPDQQRKQLEIISRSAWRMDRMIQDLLDAASLDSGRLKLTFRCEDAGAIAREACDAFRMIAENKGVRLACDTSQEVRQVSVDRGRVLQALSNYLNNAVKFTPPEGQVILVVEPTADGGARFSVADTGPGIPPDQLLHVFDRFWQGRGASQEGAGLGLAIASSIAKAHRGRTWVESTEGVGSTFYLKIPGAKECA